MAAQPQATIIPFADLPDCAADCGPLFDANGACVPPVVPAVDEACFCKHSGLAGFRSGIDGVCDDVCTGGDAEKSLLAIQNWFAETCGVKKASINDDDKDNNSGGSSKSNSGGGEVGGLSWLEMHWRWVVMIVVLTVAIIAIWVAAFWWRRRHLRRKELKLSLGKNPAHSSWGPGAAPPPGAEPSFFEAPPGGMTPQPKAG